MGMELLALGVAVAQTVSGGIRTDRLTPRERETWKKIVAVVRAAGKDGQPLHPKLRALWDAVDASGHAVYIEMPDDKAPAGYLAGRFAVTRVDPEGKAHEGILILNPRAIDTASTGGAGRRTNGFLPFEGLGRWQRYAEVLGHELAHAVWSFGDPDRARLASRIQGETEQQMQMLLAAQALGKGAEIQEHVAELDRLGRVLEEPAEAAEVPLWAELRAGQRAR